MIALQTIPAHAICYTGKTRRCERLLLELGRVGVADPNITWSFDTPYRKWLLRRIPHRRSLDLHPGAWGATLAHYTAIKTAYELGAENALVVEDDCRFLTDVHKVEEAFSHVPADWDILMLDHFLKKPIQSGNGFWQRCASAMSSACYIVNRRAMEKLVFLYESPVNKACRRPTMRNCDHWTNVRYLGRKIVLYCATPNLAIQCDCGDTTNYNATRGMSVQKRLYRRYGLHLENYQCF